MTGIRQHSFHTLDGMRGIAAIAVMFYHMKLFHTPDLFSNGLLAVDVFYILSGFVISYAYDMRISQGLIWKQFLILRYIRLVPLIALGVTLGLAQALWAPDLNKDAHLSIVQRIAGAALNIVILPSFVGNTSRMFPTNPPEWSLFYELLVNIFYIFTYKLLKKQLFIITLIMLSAVVEAVGIFHFHGATFGPSRHAIVFGLSRVTFSFFLGVFLQRNRKAWETQVPRFPHWTIYLILLAILATPVPSKALPAYHCLVILLLGPTLVILGAATEPRYRMREASIWLGRISYPLYAIHMPIVYFFYTLAPQGGLLSVLTNSLAAVFAIVSSSLLPAYFDEPIRRKLTRFFSASNPNGHAKAADAPQKR